MNRAEIIGNLGRDPDIRSMQDGTKVANLSVATAERWTDKQSGERRERTDWHPVVIFGGPAEVAEKYLRKRSKVFIAGKLQTRKYQAQDGQDRYTTEIVLNGFRGELEMLDSKPDRDQRIDDDWQAPAGGQAAQATDPDDLDDSIPFITNGGAR